jgi:hypothetical protein
VSFDNSEEVKELATWISNIKFLLIDVKIPVLSQPSAPSIMTHLPVVIQQSEGIAWTDESPKNQPLSADVTATHAPDQVTEKILSSNSANDRAPASLMHRLSKANLPIT